jgi:hypothetical protein
VLRPAYIGGAPDPTDRLRLAAAATVLEPAYIGATPHPTTRVQLASSAAILGLAVADGATAGRPGSAACIRASSSACRTATVGPVVLSGSVLGRALCAAATANGLALAASAAALGTASYAAAPAPDATLGLHEAVGTSWLNIHRVSRSSSIGREPGTAVCIVFAKLESSLHGDRRLVVRYHLVRVLF